jgi:hypothetical protein
LREEKSEEQDVFCDIHDRACDNCPERTDRLMLVISVLKLEGRMIITLQLPNVFR